MKVSFIAVCVFRVLVTSRCAGLSKLHCPFKPFYWLKRQIDAKTITDSIFLLEPCEGRRFTLRKVLRKVVVRDAPPLGDSLF
jgi:hypothetical protein